MARRNMSFDEMNYVDPRFYRKHSIISLNRNVLGNMENSRKNGTTDLYKQSFLGRTRATANLYNKADDTGSLCS